MYLFCNSFEGSREKDYLMVVGHPNDCGSVSTYEDGEEYVIMCQEHINANQEETLRLKMEHNKQLASLGIPSEVYPEDYYGDLDSGFEFKNSREKR